MKQDNPFRRFVPGNRGSGLVTVLITAIIIIALGTTVLFTSLSGFQIKVTDRESTENFYDAETLMTLIRAGVQSAASESIAGAYSYMLVSHDVDTDPESFAGYFRTTLSGWTDADDRPLFSKVEASEDWTYDPAVLAGFLAASPLPEGAVCTLSYTDYASGEELDYDPDSADAQTGRVELGDYTITLLGVHIDYTCDGYMTDIAADLVIHIPSYSYIMNEYSLNGIPSFATIARVALVQSGAAAPQTLSGNAYAGRLELSDAGQTLTLTNGKLISQGDIEVGTPFSANQQRLVSDATSTVWVNRILVRGADAAISLTGSTYVADDLELAGRSAAATLDGRYYGFGYLNSATGSYSADGLTAATSSSILINGKDAALNLSGLSTLMLAGQSFVEGSGNNSDTLMGQSVSAKSDQLAYLVPSEFLTVNAGGTVTGSNPYIFSGDLSYVCDENALRQYAGAGATVQLVTNALPSTGGGNYRAAYFYVHFASKEDANRFFKSYFEQNSSAIERYLDLYVSSIDMTEYLQTSGNTYADYSEDSDALNLLDPVRETTLSTLAAQLQTMYDNLCVTMSESVPAASVAPAGDPYEYVVRSDDIAAYLSGDNLTDGRAEFKNEAGQTLALIVRNEFGTELVIDDAFKTQYPYVRFIIAEGNAAVTSDFVGLLLCGGTVTMTANLTASENETMQALAAETEIEYNGETLTVNTASFTILGEKIQTGVIEEPEGYAESWKPEDLVSYKNWTKNG